MQKSDISCISQSQAQFPAYQDLSVTELRVHYSSI